jgi:tetratricopeptide (TPR) repeat protein
MSSPSDTRIKTNFLENQAKEVSDKKMSKGPLIAFGIVFLAGISFAGYKVTEFLMNYETIAMMKNIELILDSPTTKNGQATVDIVVRNNNPFPVQNFEIAYTIDGTTGGSVSKGVAKIENLVPAADERKFATVSLGAMNGEPGKMHVDLTGAKISEKSKLPGDVQQRITDALFLKEQDSLAAFQQLDKELPNNPVILNGLALTYEECSQKDKAKETYEKSISTSQAGGAKGGPDAAEAATPTATPAGEASSAEAASGATHNSTLENAHYHLGLLLLNTDKKKAQAEFEAAAQLDPNDPAVKAELEKLK